MTPTSSPDPDPAVHGDTRIRVVRGGQPTAGQLAAIGLALAHRDPPGPEAATGAWRRAALLEAAGERPIPARADLRDAEARRRPPGPRS